MKNLKIWLFVNIWISLFLVSVTYGVEGENIVRNPSFEDGVDQWQLLVTAPAAAVWEAEDEGVAGQCAHISVTNVSGTDWHIEIHQSGQPLEAGQEYTFNVWGKTADVPNRPIGPGLEGIGGAGDWWETFIITEEWQEFSRTWVQAVAGSSTVHFALGQVKGEIWLDHIRLYEGVYVEADLEDFKQDQAVELRDKLAITWGGIKAID